MSNNSKSISEMKILILKAIERGHNNSYQIEKWLKTKGVGIDRSRTLKRHLNDLEKDGYVWKKDMFLRKPQKCKVVEWNGNIVAFKKIIKLRLDDRVRDSKITRKDLKGYKLTFKAYKLLLDMERKEEKQLPSGDAKFVWPKED